MSQHLAGRGIKLGQNAIHPVQRGARHQADVQLWHAGETVVLLDAGHLDAGSGIQCKFGLLGLAVKTWFE